jgi:hypothetical protein
LNNPYIILKKKQHFRLYQHVGEKRHTYVYARIGSKQTSLTLVTLMK